MNNVSIQSIKARYKELFPLGVDKKEFIEILEYFKVIEDKRFLFNCKSMNYKPYMVAYLLKYLTKHERYPTLLSLNVHEIVEIYMNGSQDGTHVRLTDIKEDILLLNVGFNEPNNKIMRECINYVITNYITQDKYLFIYARGNSLLVKDVEAMCKDMEIPIYSLTSTSNNQPTKVTTTKKSNLF